MVFPFKKLVPHRAFFLSVLLRAVLSSEWKQLSWVQRSDGEPESHPAAQALFCLHTLESFSLLISESGHLGIKNLREDGQNSRHCGTSG